MQDRSDRRIVVLGAAMAAFIVGQMIAAKATRDALFLTSFDIGLLPRMVVISAIVSAIVTLSTTRLRIRSDPRRMTAALAVVSAGLLVTFYLFAKSAPHAVAALFYLHTMSLGPLMASGFWSVINEALDPRSAKAAVGKISAGGTLGAIVGGLLAERVAAAAQVESVLLFLVGANVVCLLTLPLFPRAGGPPAADGAQSQGSALKIVFGSPFLRTVAGLVALTVMGAALLDYALKAEAVLAFGRGEPLLRFFAWYYVATSVVSFFVQVGLGRWFLKKLGVVRTVSALPLSAIVAGGVGLLLGGIIAATVARALEGIVRSSLYRAGYELLYTPIAPAQKRAGKPLIEIVIDRAAEAAGGGLISLLVWAFPAKTILFCFSGAIACGIGGFFLVRMLQSGYVGALADQLESLPNIPAAAALAHEGTFTIDGRGGLTAYLNVDAQAEPAPGSAAPHIVTQLGGLISSDIEIVRRTLKEARPLDGRLVSAVIPLLDDKSVKTEAMETLREVGAQHLGQFGDVLANHKMTNFRLRARIAHLLASFSKDPRVVDALIIGLSDSRFEVRLACGRSLLKLREQGDLERPERFFIEAKNELHRMKKTPAPKPIADFGQEDDAFAKLVEDRSQRSTEHLFRLIALALDKEAIERAFKGVLSGDKLARGTALEYLENVLPADLWEALSPLVDAGSQ